MVFYIGTVKPTPICYVGNLSVMYNKRYKILLFLYNLYYKNSTLVVPIYMISLSAIFLFSEITNYDVGLDNFTHGIIFYIKQ